VWLSQFVGRPRMGSEFYDAQSCSVLPSQEYHTGEYAAPPLLGLQRHSAPCASSSSVPGPCKRCSGTGRRGLLGPRGLGLVSRKCTCECAAVLLDEKERRAVTSDFMVIRQLGRGSFGKVLQVQPRRPSPGLQPQCNYAMKLLHKDRYADPALFRYLVSEQAVLQSLDHPFVISLVHATETPNHYVLVMDFAPGGSLGEKLAERPARSPGCPQAEVCRYAADILVGLEYLHSRRIVFRDLKPDNVVLDENQRCRLTDFGLAKHNYDEVMGASSAVGSAGYAAPEVFAQRGRYTEAVDWYALGATIYMLLSGGIRVEGGDGRPRVRAPATHVALVASVQQWAGSAEAKGLVQQLIHDDPAKRGSGSSIRQHAFFRGVNFHSILPVCWRPRRCGRAVL